MIGSTRYVAGQEIARQNQLSSDIGKLQQSISSNVRLQAPSDDAAASARISEIRQTQADQLVWSRNAATGTAVASAADTALLTVTNMLQRAKELTLAGSNQTANAKDRSINARELRGLADDLDTLATANDPNGNALFPATAPIEIPVANGIKLAATASRTTIFGSVPATAGTKSLSRVLRDAADALEAPDSGQKLDINGVPVVDAGGNPVTVTRDQRITESISDLDAADVHHLQMVTDQGLRGKRFDDAKDDLASRATDLKVERSGLEDTDLTYAVTAFQSKSLALQAAQTIYAQANKRSLFDLLG